MEYYYFYIYFYIKFIYLFIINFIYLFFKVKQRHYNRVLLEFMTLATFFSHLAGSPLREKKYLRNFHFQIALF